LSIPHDPAPSRPEQAPPESSKTWIGSKVGNGRGLAQRSMRGKPMFDPSLHAMFVPCQPDAHTPFVSRDGSRQMCPA
jgi:hypothetical protein